MTTRLIARMMVCSVLTAGSAVSAEAGATPPPSEAIRVQVTELYKKGNELVDQGKLVEAEASYREAWNLLPTYDVATNLGAVLLDLRRPSEAAELLRYGAKNYPAGGKAERRREIEDRFAKAREQVGTVRIEIRSPRTVDAKAMRITIDGRPVAAFDPAGDVYVDPGRRTIEVTHEEYLPAQYVLEAAKGSTQKVTLTLVPRSGTALGTSGAPGWPIYVGTGTSAVLVGVGVALTIAAGRQASDADTQRDELRSAGTSCPDGCEALRSSYETADQSHNAAAGLYVAGGVIALTTVAYALLAPGEKEAGRAFVRPIPTITATFQGFSIAGSF